MLDQENQDQYWMQQAINLAKTAELSAEVPIGAVLVLDNKLIGQGYNQPITLNDPSAHAEILALRQAAMQLQNYRLPGTTLYVTLEPCAMCQGALIHARVARVVYGASDSNKIINHKISYTPGIEEEQCSLLLTQFFQAKR